MKRKLKKQPPRKKKSNIGADLNHKIEDVFYTCDICKTAKPKFSCYRAYLHNHYADSVKKCYNSSDPACDSPRGRTKIIKLDDYEKHLKKTDHNFYCLSLEENSNETIAKFPKIESVFSLADQNSLDFQSQASFSPKIINSFSVSLENANSLYECGSNGTCVVSEDPLLSYPLEAKVHEKEFKNNESVCDTQPFMKNISSDSRSFSIEKSIQSSKIKAELFANDKMASSMELKCHSVLLNEKMKCAIQCSTCGHSSNYCPYENMHKSCVSKSSTDLSLDSNCLCYHNKCGSLKKTENSTNQTLDYFKSTCISEVCNVRKDFKNISSNMDFDIINCELTSDSTKKEANYEKYSFHLEHNVNSINKGDLKLPISDFTLQDTNMANLESPTPNHTHCHKNLDRNGISKIPELVAQISYNCFAPYKICEEAANSKVGVSNQSGAKNAFNHMSPLLRTKHTKMPVLVSTGNREKSSLNGKYGDCDKSASEEVKLIEDPNSKPHFYFDQRSKFVCAECYSSVNKCDISTHYKEHGYVSNVYNIYDLISSKH
ncbi:uncharacterized protein [Parasteatoda tepidariorum]|uniref:uncharacterized protein n=1 Tax=Parasteatoda tepidariorum TaxID=114398 RepID=UPI00077FE10F|nr:uncharacterized protein LOC107456938 [Parasteatoda tepidariorum]XP_042901241.1 uncharacterized protein LOC107456938 [Parasteatoda tepidariorum]XP_042901242.1 uncharacterized protein LOC107456938 [Parasteatoda tepidariorum]XP_042901243.1 uncharacterized protein LOC107456938 [Parasteatoda tepidariorum]